MQCANDLAKPMIGMHIHGDEKDQVPPQLQGRRVISWGWDGYRRAKPNAHAGCYAVPLQHPFDHMMPLLAVAHRRLSAQRETSRMSDDGGHDSALPHDDDPFFSLSGDRKWNALIGRQGDEENYVDGYIEAAMELAGAVIEKRMYGKRDTLIMPILYNARHALELSLKFAVSKLRTRSDVRKNHDLRYHWNLLQRGPLGDEALRGHVAALEPYVASLSEIDEDGQELRYSERRKGEKSLAGRRLANIEVIRASLGRLSRAMADLKNRVLDLLHERTTGSCTPECSRRDLLETARMLPNRSDWGEPAFLEAKASMMARFGVTGRGFSKGLKIIENNREMRVLIGLTTDLAHISAEKLLFAVEQWARLDPARTTGDDPRIVGIGDLDANDIAEHSRTAAAVNAAILEALTSDEIADLETIFYIGREGQFCETYERRFEMTQQEHRAADDLGMEVDHLMQKLNFQGALARGLSILGRPDLADKLGSMRRDVVPG